MRSQLEPAHRHSALARVRGLAALIAVPYDEPQGQGGASCLAGPGDGGDPRSSGDGADAASMAVEDVGVSEAPAAYELLRCLSPGPVRKR